ncbi:MFS transporter [Rosistilla oblonga]|uniref:MFS transporter n=1 Tax=Rosistilla oblonga TaxID=2527990 RepID=UPI003A971048
MKSNLVKRGFLSLLAAQFLGAMNDNVLKMLLTFMVIDGAWAGMLGDGGQGIVGICFTIPFILLSGYGGQIADRYSKREVTLWVKIAEVPIALIAMVGFYLGNLWITLLALVALTCQSSFFGPAKYGMIPELVDDTDLSRANGTINMMTNVAVIVGTLLGGVVADRYSPQDASLTPIQWLPGAALLVIAILGLISAVFMPRLEPGDRSMKFDWNPFATYLGSIQEMAQSRFLMVMMAWGYFYLLAGLALLILPEYTVVLGIDRTEASVLLGVMGVAIGVGCAVAGLISGHQINPKLVPIGAAGLVFFFLLLAFVTPTLPDQGPMVRVALSNTAGFVFGAGFFAGFYIIPLQSLLQKLSPDNERGRFLGTANALSFTFLTIASLMYWVIRPLFGDQPQRIFAVCAAMMAAGAAFFLWRLRGTGILIGSKSTDVESAPAVAESAE